MIAKQLKKIQWVQLRVLIRTVCENILGVMENRKKIKNSNLEFKFKI